MMETSWARALGALRGSRSPYMSQGAGKGTRPSSWDRKGGAS